MPERRFEGVRERFRTRLAVVVATLDVKLTNGARKATVVAPDAAAAGAAESARNRHLAS